MTKRKAALWLGLAGVVAFVLAASWYYWFAPAPPFRSPRTVVIAEGESFRAIATALKNAGVVRSSLALVVYAEVTGGARHVQPGEYEFKGGERIAEVMGHLVRGDFVTVTVIIPEGLTVREIGARLESAGLVCEDQFERDARGGKLVTALGLEPLGAEGYLFPATYRLPPHVSVDQVLSAMLSRFFRLLTPAIEERLFELRLTERQMVTLASIVEKEAKVPGERPLIAGVFYNRLRLGMPLQSDPTAQYGLGEEKEPVSLAVRTPTAFNTYTFAGLPPGPIANPGYASIEAVLHPVKTDYLYFVARADGTHSFSRSFDEHRRAIAAIIKAAAAARGGERAHRSSLQDSPARGQAH